MVYFSHYPVDELFLQLHQYCDEVELVDDSQSLLAAVHNEKYEVVTEEEVVNCKII